MLGLGGRACGVGDCEAGGDSHFFPVVRILFSRNQEQERNCSLCCCPYSRPSWMVVVGSPSINSPIGKILREIAES